MRLALLADVHGNLAALEAVLADADAQGATVFVAAGDHLATGPRPVECFELLDSRGALIIRGNNDHDLLQMRRGRAPAWWRDGLHYGPLRWTAGRLTSHVLSALETLPEQRVVRLDGAPPIRVVHGSPSDVREPVLPIHGQVVTRLARITGIPGTTRQVRALSDVLARVREPVMVCGHTHLAWHACHHGQLAVNPGSVGVPTNGTGAAEYAFLTLREGIWQAELRTIPYDLARLRADYDETGLYDAGGPIGRTFLADTLSGQCLCIMFFWHARRLARQQGLADQGWLPDRIWHEAEETFDRAAASKLFAGVFAEFSQALRKAGDSCEAGERGQAS